MYLRKTFQLIGIALLFCLPLSLAAQVIPNVQARFANPEFDKEENIYRVDIQLKADQETQYLFGFNVRFFYDVEVMEFEGFSNFADNYDILGRAPKNIIGNSNSGRQLFSMSGAAAYINTAVQLQGQEENALALRKDDWATVFQAEFKVYDHVANTDKDFCPSIIWDLERPEKSRGGFFPNEDGIVFTVLERDPSTPQISTASYSSAATFNWKYTNRSDFPYGIPVAEQCLSLSVATSVTNPLEGIYKVHQNRPNPFDSETFIGFEIPKSTKVKLRIMDVSGKTLMEQLGDYDAGFHSIRVENANALLGASQILFYQIETDEYLSPTFRMNRIKR